MDNNNMQVHSQQLLPSQEHKTSEVYTACGSCKCTVCRL